MKTKQHAQLKRGDEVTWVSQASGFSKKKTGVVVLVLSKGMFPRVAMCPPEMKVAYRQCGYCPTRDHRSYVVKAGDKLYWCPTSGPMRQN